MSHETIKITGKTQEEIKAKIEERIRKAADAGIGAVGPIQALNAALVTQHELVHQFFEYVKQAWEYSQRSGTPPILPLADEVLHAFNNAAGSMQMVAEIMSRGVLNEYEADRKNAAVHSAPHGPLN